MVRNSLQRDGKDTFSVQKQLEAYIIFLRNSLGTFPLLLQKLNSGKTQLTRFFQRILISQLFSASHWQSLGKGLRVQLTPCSTLGWRGGTVAAPQVEEAHPALHKKGCTGCYSPLGLPLCSHLPGPAERLALGHAPRQPPLCHGGSHSSGEDTQTLRCCSGTWPASRDAESSPSGSAQGQHH